jgi:hypothetical protein
MGIKDGILNEEKIPQKAPEGAEGLQAAEKKKDGQEDRTT